MKVVCDTYYQKISQLLKNCPLLFKKLKVK